MKYFSISANYSLQILVVNPKDEFFQVDKIFDPHPFFYTAKHSRNHPPKSLSYWANDSKLIESFLI